MSARLDPLDECLRCYLLLTAPERVAFLLAVSAETPEPDAGPPLLDEEREP